MRTLLFVSILFLVSTVSCVTDSIYPMDNTYEKVGKNEVLHNLDEPESGEMVLMINKYGTTIRAMGFLDTDRFYGIITSHPHGVGICDTVVAVKSMYNECDTCENLCL